MSMLVPSLSSTFLCIQQQLTRYVYSTFLIFGVIGSCLNILLLSRRQFCTSSCCIYLLAMSVAILILLSWIIGLYLYALDHVDPVTSMVVFCKLRIYVLQSSALTYRWCLTVACLDRYALSAMNVRLRNLARVSVARRAVLVLVIVWIVLPMHSLILYNLRDNNCGILYSSAGALYHSIFTTVAASVLPPVIMLTCAVLIYRNLVRKRHRRQLITAQDSTRNNKTRKLLSRRDHQVLVMLLIQVAFYIVTTIPLMAMYFYNALTLYVSDKSPDRLAIERFAQYVAEVIVFLLPACSFYLYTMASRTFRAELISAIRSACRALFARNTTRVVPIGNDMPLRGCG